MLVHLRRAGSLVVVALVSLALVVGPAIQPAAAFSIGDWTANMRNRVYALRAPSSTMAAAMPAGSSDPNVSVRRVAGMRANAAAGARGVTMVPADSVTRYTDPTSPRKFAGKMAGAAGTAVTMAWGVNLVYDQFTGNGVLGSNFGFGGLYSADSEGLVCDLTAAVTGTHDCALGPGGSYTPNADLGVLTPPGWDFDTNAESYYIAPWVVIESPDGTVAYGATTGRQRIVLNSGGLGWPYAQQAAMYCINVATGKDLGTVAAKWQGDGDQRTATFDAADCAAKGAGGGLRQIFINVGVTTTSGPVGVRGFYYPPGHTKRPPDVDVNPPRTWETTWRCSDGSVGTKTSDPWREADPEWPLPPEPSCTSGSLTYVKVQQLTSGMDPVVLYEWELPGELSAFAEQYPECTKGSCLLELHRVDAATGTRLACFDQPDACLNWFEDPQRATNYQCTYGTHDVELRECYAYANMFDRAQATEEGTYADPDTGAAPDVTPGPAPSPTAGCGNPPAFEMSLGGIGYWVAHGTLWSLCQAFVPAPAAVSTDMQALQAGFSTHAPFSALAVIPSVVGGFTQGWTNSCASMPNFSTLQGKPLRLPCSPPDSAGFKLAYGLQVMLLWSGVVFGVWRMGHAAVGGK